jgi:hypothetical protein
MKIKAPLKQFIAVTYLGMFALALAVTAQTNRTVSELPLTLFMQSNDTLVVSIAANGVHATRGLTLQTLQSLPGWANGTNGTSTNGLATVSFVQQAVTNVTGTLFASNIVVANNLMGAGALSLPNTSSTSSFGGQVVAALLNTTNAFGTNNLAGNVTVGGNLVAGNVVPLQGGYVPYTNLNPVVYANWVQFTNAINGKTNGTIPANPSTIRAWIVFTNITGGTFELPLYQ